jgi:uracil-DNA glycosylase family 4
MTSPRDTYLAWQAEIGGDEVVLTAPWVRPAPTAMDPHSSHPQQGPRSAPPSRFPEAGAPKAGPEFFQSIAEKLAKSAAARPPENLAKKVAAPAAAASGSAGSASTLPEFKDLDAYWTWLAEVWPQWFPGLTGPLVRAEGHSSPRLAVVELSPSGSAQGSAEGNRLFPGEAGVLLDKMMSAIGLTREDMYLTSVMKTLPARPDKPWARKDLARAVPALLRELKLARCEMVLLLGETCAQIVLKTGRGLDTLAGTATETEGMALTATWHPADMLRDEALKKPAWAQLQWVRGRLPARGSR